MHTILFFLGLGVFLLGMYYQWLAKNNQKADIEYSTFEKMYYSQMPPFKYLTELGKKYARRAYTLGFSGLIILGIFAFIDSM
jgi:hypothetical protein